MLLLPSGWPSVAANGTMVLSIARCMMNWKRVRHHCRPSGWRDNAEYSVVRHFTEYYRRSGHRNTWRCRWRFPTRRAGILDPRRAASLPEWGHVGDALEPIYVAP